MAGKSAEHEKRPSTVSTTPSQSHRLRLHHTELANALSDSLSAILRKDFRLTFGKIEVLPYRKAAESFPSESCLVIFKLQPMKGFGLCEISPKLGAAVVDRLLGGGGAAPEKERAFTEMEQAFLRRFGDMIIRGYSASWERFQKLDWQGVGFESSAQIARVIPSETTVLSVVLGARFGEVEGGIRLLFPYAHVEKMIETLLGEVSREAGVASIPKTGALDLNLCENISISVTAHWRGLAVTLGQLRDLAVGDLLQLDPSQCEKAIVDLGEVSKFLGRMETRERRVQITLLSKI